jgi:hypothetical protein
MVCHSLLARTKSVGLVAFDSPPRTGAAFETDCMEYTSLLRSRTMENLNEPAGLKHETQSRVGRFFASRWLPVAAVAIALLLTFRSVNNGLEADDYYHRAVLAGSPRFHDQLRGPQAMFRFLIGEPEHNRRWMDVGFLPWWTDPDIKAEFFQLIPTQTHIFDYWLWSNQPALMHVHSLVWFAVLILLVARFYRQILGPTWLAGVAALLFAIDDAHSAPIGWICNRNDLIAATFGVGCLIAHDLWRREKRLWSFWASAVLLALSLCSKEAGIATCAYLFAYALWLDKSTLWQRALTLVPYGVVLILWRAVRDAQGYGVAHIGYYVDPITDPWRFVEALLGRFPVLLFGQWAMFSDISIIFRKLLGSPFWWIAVGYIGLLGLVLFPLIQRDRIARYFATGMLLAVIPSCATFPMDRLLTFVGLGAFGLLAQFWNLVFVVDPQRPQPFLWRMVALPVALLLIVLHVVLAPLLLTVRVTAPVGPREMIASGYVRVPFDETIEQQDLIVVNAPIPMFVGYCLLNFEHDGKPVPRAVRSLAPGNRPMSITRTDVRTLEVEPETGYLILVDKLFRNESRPLHVGEKIHVARMTATILTVTADGRPQKVEFRFETALEDPSLRWLRFQAGEFLPWNPPAIGETVILTSDWNRKLW